MLTIRLRRQGARGRPFYRLVVIDSRLARDGRALEVVGHYDPTKNPEALTVKRERIDHWVARGAQMSDTVRTLLVRHPAPPAGDEALPAAATDPAASAGGGAAGGAVDGAASGAADGTVTAAGAAGTTAPAGAVP